MRARTHARLQRFVAAKCAHDAGSAAQRGRFIYFGHCIIFDAAKEGCDEEQSAAFVIAYLEMAFIGRSAADARI